MLIKCKCGTSLKDNVKFCPECGTPAPKPEPDPVKAEDPFRGYPPAIKIEDVAKILGIGLNRAYEHAQNGDFPAIKIGKRWRVSTKKFFEWLDGNPPSTSPRKAMSR